ncbi:MAG: peroxidase family protein [Planctomycetota bacterium]
MSSNTHLDTSETGGSDWVVARDTAAKLIDERKYRDAIEVLQELATDPRGEISGLLGLAHYQLEDYSESATQFETALAHDSANPEWQAMYEMATANAVSELNVPVPDVYYFDKEILLSAPEVREGSLPTPPTPPSRPGLLYRLCLGAGNLLGSIASRVMGLATNLWGTIAGYRDRVWTNWYHRPQLLGILTLAYMREKLNKHNLKNTYPRGTLIGFQKPGQMPPLGVTHFRTADGSWNNLANPKEGAAGTRFARNVENSEIRPETGERLMSPNPREISRKLLTREGEMKKVPFLNLLAASWIQFQNHDWVNHGEVVFDAPLEIPLAEDDPARKKFHQTKMFVGRTQKDPTRREGQEETPITFINEVTHWWDGSQVYGSDQETVDRLRSHVDGKLRLTAEQTLPLSDKGVEDTGFVRNWWVGLSMLHTLFAREHNAICDNLKTYYPQWDDNRLFNVARLINAAVMAKIHTVEWTPAILPNPGLNAALNANWFGLATNLFKTGKHRETLAVINIKNPEVGGVVGNPINKHGQPYGLTQEFVEVYRLHSLLPESLEIKRFNHDGPAEQIPLPQTRQAGSPKTTEHVPMAELFYSFGNQLPGQLVLNNYPKFMQELSIPGNPIFDLGAVDLLRARERGVPRYNEFRRQLGLNPIRSFEDLTDDKQQLAKLKDVYGDKPADVEKLDLMIGTLSEAHRPTNFGFGETMFQIFILNATRRLQADRFYTDDYDEHTYTREGLQWVDNSDFKTVLLRHYPELAKTGLANVRNAFEPWDTAEQLDPERHPLRAYDKELKPDPWRGDAHR